MKPEQLRSQIFFSEVGGAQNGAKRRLNVEFTFVRWTETAPNKLQSCLISAGCVKRQQFSETTLYVDLCHC